MGVASHAALHVLLLVLYDLVYLLLLLELLLLLVPSHHATRSSLVRPVRVLGDLLDTRETRRPTETHDAGVEPHGGVDVILVGGVLVVIVGLTAEAVAALGA